MRRSISAASADAFSGATPVRTSNRSDMPDSDHENFSGGNSAFSRS